MTEKTIRLITVFNSNSILLGKQSSQKLQSLSGNPIVNNDFAQRMNHNLTILHVGSRLCPPNLKDVVGLAEAQLTFNFHNIFSIFFPANRVYPAEFTNLASLHPSNLANTSTNVVIQLCKIQFWKKLFTKGFSYKHCNFRPLCLPRKMAAKTVNRPISTCDCLAHPSTMSRTHCIINL